MLLPRVGLAATIGVVPIDLNECFAVAPALRSRDRGRQMPRGEQLHESNTYDGKLGNLGAADRLTTCLAWWAHHLSGIHQLSFNDIDLVASVPSNPPKKPFDLPAVLARGVAKCGTSSSVPHSW
jgi:hypothetical protein